MTRHDSNRKYLDYPPSGWFVLDGMQHAARDGVALLSLQIPTS